MIFTTQINLDGYTAQIVGTRVLKLGTYESYGIEKLYIVPGDDWKGLTVTATFVMPTQSVRVVIPESGIIDVPQEATAKALTSSDAGKIVFSGVSNGVQKITTDIRFLVSDHANVNSTNPQPTPSEWEQFVSQVQDSAQAAEIFSQKSKEYANESYLHAENAKKSAASASSYASQAKSSEENVKKYAETATSIIESAKNGALDEIDKETEEKIQEIKNVNAEIIDQAQAAEQNAEKSAESAKGYALQAKTYSDSASSSSQTAKTNAQAAAASAAAAQQAAQQALGFRTFFSAISPDANGDLDPSRPMTSPTAATVTVKSTGDRIQSVQVNGFTTQAGTGEPSRDNVRAITTGGKKLVEHIMTGEENWTFDGTYFVLALSIKPAQSYGGDIYATIYKGMARVGFSGDKVIASSTQNILVLDSRFSSADTFKSYLSQLYSDGNPLIIWYTPGDGSQATGLYIPDEIQGHEYRCKCLELTAPLCQGDKVRTRVKSGCDQTITLDGTNVAVTASGANYVATATNAVAGGAVYAADLAYLTLAAGQIVIPATSFPLSVTSAQTANAWLQSNPQKVWYQSTVYAKQNDIPVQLETHDKALVTVDGTNTVFAQGTSGYTVSLSGAANGALICDRFANLTAVSNAATIPASQFPSSVTDVGSANAWAKSNNVTILYTLSAPCIYARDPVDLVAVPYTEADATAAQQLASTPSTLPYIDDADVPMLLASDAQATPASLTDSLVSTLPVAGTYEVSSQSGTTVAVSLKAMQNGGDAETLGGALPYQYQMPIGFIFQWLPVSGQSVDLSTPENVAAYFGYGTWQNVASGQFLIGQDSGYAAGSTGGEATHTLTTAEVPEFYNVVYGGSGGSSAYLAGSAVYTAGSYGGIVQNVPLNNEGGKAHNNMPPYLAVYTWQRIE